MEVPESFKILSRCFDDYTLPMPLVPELWIERSLASLDAATKSDAKRFLTESLHRDPTAGELKNIWNTTAIAYYVDGENVRPFFELILNAL